VQHTWKNAHFNTAIHDSIETVGVYFVPFLASDDAYGTCATNVEVDSMLERERGLSTTPSFHFWGSFCLCVTMHTGARTAYVCMYILRSSTVDSLALSHGSPGQSAVGRTILLHDHVGKNHACFYRADSSGGPTGYRLDASPCRFLFCLSNISHRPHQRCLLGGMIPEREKQV